MKKLRPPDVSGADPTTNTVLASIAITRATMEERERLGGTVSEGLELWTPETLQPFLEAKAKYGRPVRLANGTWVMNDEMHRTRLFDTIKRNGLLPFYKETHAQWRRRIAIYEKGSGVDLNSMAMVTPRDHSLKARRILFTSHGNSSICALLSGAGAVWRTFM